MRQVVLSILCVLFFSPVFAAENPLLSSEEVTWLQEHPAPVRVHNESDWSPFNFNEAGEPKGYSIDYMNLVAAKVGLDVEYISGRSWSEFLEMMKDGSLDVMVNIASTKERRKYLAFTDAYFITRTSLYVLNSRTGISDLDDLAGKKIGFTRGFFFEDFIRKYYPEIEIVTFDSTLSSFKGVEQGVVDAAIEVPVVGQRVLREAQLSTVKKSGVISDPRFITTFYIATRKDSPILRSIIQKGMDAVSPEEELFIRRKWKIEESTTSPISKDEKHYLSQLNSLKVCVNPDRLPLEAVNADGTLTGISSEFLKLLDERMEVSFSIVRSKSWSETLRFAEKGECDLLPMMTQTSDRSKYLNFTSPWLSVPVVVATRQDQIYISSLGQVTNHRFGVVKGLAITEILHSVYPDLKLVTVNSVKRGLEQVEDGELFGFIGTVPAISRTLQTESIPTVKISGDVGLDIDFSVGVKKDDAQLLGIVEKSLAAIDSAQIVNIYNRWLSIAYIDRFDYTRFWQMLAGFILLTSFLLYRYRRGVQITAKLRKAHAEIEAINLKLNEQARTDPLTMVANRLRLDEALFRELSRFERTQVPFSVILLDLDRFKQVNDTYGHHAGDMVLRSVAEILENNTRAHDLTGRWGGEEFLIICPSTSGEGSVSLAEHLRIAIMEKVYEEVPSQTASFGVAIVVSGDSVNDLIRRADKALYRAKEGGRNRVES